MKSALLTAVVAILAGTAYAGPGEKVAWDPADQAVEKSKATGKPILYYFLQSQQIIENGKVSGGGSC